MLNTQDRILVEQRVTNDKPSVGVAYLFAIFLLGLFGAHRFYLGRTGTGVIMLLLTLTFFGCIITGVWLFIDLFRIPGMVRDKTEDIRQKYTQEAESLSARSEGGLANMPMGMSRP